MTTEEVIKRLKWQQELYNKKYIDYLNTNEAYNIAIKILEDLLNCGKEALGRMPSIDNFEYVKSPFCPFCGVRLRKPRITKQGIASEEN